VAKISCAGSGMAIAHPAGCLVSGGATGAVVVPNWEGVSMSCSRAAGGLSFRVLLVSVHLVFVLATSVFGCSASMKLLDTRIPIVLGDRLHVGADPTFRQAELLELYHVEESSAAAAPTEPACPRCTISARSRPQLPPGILMESFETYASEAPCRDSSSLVAGGARRH
jgi:hypothetical protein